MWTNSSYVSCGHEFIMMGFFTFYLLLLPLFVFILYVGFQRWRKQRPGSPSGMTSHLDVFTYNAVVVEILGNVLVGVYVSCSIMGCNDVVEGAIPWMFFTQNALTLFHTLTCVDRYLAVIHPVRYRGLRNRSGVRIRNLSIVGVWLISLLLVPFNNWCGYYSCGYTLQILPASLGFLVVLFCCESVLCALVGPKPGDVGGVTRGRVDQSKRRAFHTMFAIMAALYVRFFAVVFLIIHFFVDPNTFVSCVVRVAFTGFHLPCSLVLPLLFLQRIRKKSAGRA